MNMSKIPKLICPICKKIMIVKSFGWNRYKIDDIGDYLYRFTDAEFFVNAECKCGCSLEYKGIKEPELINDEN